MDAERFLSMLEETLEISQGSLRAGDDLRTVETWNSATIHQLVAQIEEEFGVALQSVDVLDCPTVFDLVMLVDQRVPVK